MIRTKVLAVDDRKENLFALSNLLKDCSADLYTANSGAKALELMLEHDFALAILDIQMPEMDGFELAELMRGAEKTKAVPIIFVTAATDRTGFAFRGYEKGAVDFLVKPIDSMVLSSKVRVFIELDEQKRLLQEAKESAEDANRLKSSFLANMSHEIRTPLGAMIGFAELLEDGNISGEEKSKYSKIIRKNGQALLRLIDDVLDLSKVEAGRLEVELISFSPVELFREILSLLQRTAEQKGITLKMDVDSSIPESLTSDPTRLRQILMNIIGNAIKFTAQGEVLFHAEMLESTQPPLLRITVRDTGLGIDEATAAKLFQPFIQADNSTTRKFGGTGLGLVLSKRLAQRLGGDVRLIQSTSGQGSTFEVLVEAVPLKGTGTLKKVSKPEKEERKDLENLSILVVEDSPDNQMLLGKMLGRLGAKTSFASNGEEAVTSALSSHFDLILMDIQMPILDGYGATARLREHGYAKPIIALTAHAMSEERDRCLASGFDDHLSKPIDWPTFRTVLNRHSGHTL